ncbi:MAG: FAD-binding protein, partial [Oscillospiraceae bacterium]|nr:FAD-binding protein [Oscillospiraceae bacterium]
MEGIVQMRAELVVVGGGLAGLRAAAAAAEEGVDVLLLTSGPSASPDLSGFSAPVRCEDSLEICVGDIESSAQGINNPKLAKKLSAVALQEVEYLEELGFPFDKNEDGSYNTIQTLGATVPRLVHYQSKTGVKAMELTHKRLLEKGGRIIGTAIALSLLKLDDRIAGLIFYDHKESRLCCCMCKAVVLATGGYGAMQKFSTYTKNIYGSGYALAYKAGAEMIDMEFQQFEPCLYVYPPEIKGKVLVTTLIRRGAKLYNGQMHEFMPDYGLTPENAQKGPLARAIYSEILAGRGTPHGGVYYDVRELPDKLLFVDSKIFTQPAVDAGIDLHKELPEVAPGGHTSLGGIRVDEDCRSTVSNLFGCGEVIGGVHGANRIGGNAGAETLVFGRIAGKSAAEYVLKSAYPDESKFRACAEEDISLLAKRFGGIEGAESVEKLYEDIVENMSSKVVILRNENSLKAAWEKFAEL